ncbi:MAG: LuxR C-terminal-related transcriptional regulator, partial [Actinomycetota bacterium]|nr:LuxR C-terminal-related transcriptional regulator [Actinomycetota bacterium]
LAPRQLAELIDQRLSTVVANPSQPEARHRTLDAAVAWSWDLLEPAEQTLLRRLSVFSGGATAAAVRAVCAGTQVATDEVAHHLGRLVDHSLLVAHNGRRDLLDTVRHFARDQLTRAGETTEARNRHAAWATALAEKAEPHLTGARQRESIHTLDAENDNLRAAIDWLVTDHQGEQALRLTSSLTLWWRATNALTEGRKSFAAALGVSTNEATIVRAKALFGAALLADVQGDTDAAVARALDCLQIAAPASDAGLCARALLVNGSCALHGAAPDDAVKVLRDCVTLAREAGDPWCLAYGLVILATASGDRTGVEEAIATARASGDPIALAYALVWLARSGADPVDARDRFDEALSATAGFPCPERTAALMGIGRLASANGDLSAAQQHLDEAYEAARRADSIGTVPLALHELAKVAHLRGHLAEARDLLERALAILAQAGECSIPMWLSLARVAAAQHDLVVAEDLADRAEDYARTLGRSAEVARAMAIRADVFRRSGRVEAAQDNLEEALTLFESEGDAAGVADCLDDLGGLAVAEESFVHGATLFGAGAALRDAQGLHQFPLDHPHYDVDLGLLQTRLPADAFAQAWATGAGLASEGAIGGTGDPSAVRVAVGDEAWAQLTDKELAVVELVAQGLTNREISERLFIAPGTVLDRLHHARDKLGSLTRSALGREARRRQN